MVEKIVERVVQTYEMMAGLSAAEVELARQRVIEFIRGRTGDENTLAVEAIKYSTRPEALADPQAPMMCLQCENPMHTLSMASSASPAGRPSLCLRSRVVLSRGYELERMAFGLAQAMIGEVRIDCCQQRVSPLSR